MITLEGTTPDIDLKTIPEAMRLVAEHMQESIELNFMMGGRPAWIPLKSGGSTPLVTTGALMHSVQHTSGNTWAEVSAKDTIHQSGGVIDHPGSNKLQVFMSGGHLIFTMFTSRHNIPIPPRPYLMVQDTDVDFIEKLVTNVVIGGVTYEPIGKNRKA